MAIDFPNSPTTDQIFTSGERSWVWNGTRWLSVLQTVPREKFLVSSTEPSSPVEGDAWFDSLTAKLFIYYDSYWVEIGGTLSGPQGPEGPAGVSGGATISEFLMMGA